MGPSHHMLLISQSPLLRHQRAGLLTIFPGPQVSPWVASHFILSVPVTPTGLLATHTFLSTSAITAFRPRPMIHPGGSPGSRSPGLGLSLLQEIATRVLLCPQYLMPLDAPVCHAKPPSLTNLPSLLRDPLWSWLSLKVYCIYHLDLSSGKCKNHVLLFRVFLPSSPKRPAALRVASCFRFP